MKQSGFLMNPFAGKIARYYDRWFASPVGRYVEELENNLLLEMMGDLRGQMVLDIGCGTANHLILFHNSGMSLGVGLDPSADMLEVARKKVGGRPIFLVRGDARWLPFKNGAFDWVVSITTLEFIGQPDLALQEMKRAGKNSLLIAVLNSLALSSLLRKWQAVFRRSPFRYAHFYSPGELRRLAARILPEFQVRWRTVLLFFPVYFPTLKSVFQRLDEWLARHHSPWGSFLTLVLKRKPDVQGTRIRGSPGN